MNKTRTTTRFPENIHPSTNKFNRHILEIADLEGYQIYLVGGYIRDALLTQSVAKHSNKTIIKTKDLDYVVSKGTALRLAKSVASQLNGHYVPLDEEHDTARVVFDNTTIVDFAGCVGDKIEDDVLRRDFTINALIWDPQEPDIIIDFLGGISDLERLIVRAISEEALIDDPLRLLRAFRFCATISGAIESQTKQWITKHATKLANVSAERTNIEFFAMLAISPIHHILHELAETGLLEVVFPELSATKNVTANAFHHLGLFEHSLEAVVQLENKLPLCPQWVHEQIHKELSTGITRLAATKIATLLHDIGKPDTWTITPEGRHCFHKHDKLGSDMATDIAVRMKWSKTLERLVTKLIRWHLRPGQLFHNGFPTERALHRFYRALGDDTPELILLALADFGATCGPAITNDTRSQLEHELFELFPRYLVFKEEKERRIQLLNGSDVMKLLDIQAGPKVGQILKALDEAQALKKVSNRLEAEHFVVNYDRQK